MLLLRELVEEDEEFKLGELESRRPEIIRSYLEGLRLNREE